MHAVDRIATIFHEIIERNLVLYGVDYDRAHETQPYHRRMTTETEQHANHVEKGRDLH